MLIAVAADPSLADASDPPPSTVEAPVAFRYRRTADRADRKHRALAAEPSPHRLLEDLVEQQQRCALLLRALDELPRDKRVAVSLHVLDELSGPQVAQVLGLNVDASMTRS
jgi:DNA-directed RNA polymerase specialized sigma24 family protein